MNIISRFESLSLNTINNSFLAKLFFANALIILASKISIPFYPVPLSLQTMAVMGIAIFSCRKIALLSISAYLIEGLCGLPVFVSMNAGPSVFLSTTGGYLIGFLAVGYICSIKRKFFQNTFLNTFVLQMIASIALYTLGVGYLSTIIGIDNAIKFGLYPFLLGDLCKVLFISSINNFRSK